MPLGLYGCNGQTPKSSNTAQKTTMPTETPLVNLTSEQNAPIAIGKLDNKTIHFWCPAENHCLPDLSLEDNLLIDPPYELGPLFYVNPTSVYGILYSNQSFPEEREIFHINPQTHQIISSKLPQGLRNVEFMVAGNRLVFVDDGGKKVSIVQNDLSTQDIELNYPVNSLITMNDHKVIALNKQPIDNNGEVYVEISILDVNSRNFSNQDLKLPGLLLSQAETVPESGEKYLITIEGISRDLENLYCLYFLGSAPQTPRLGAFSFKNGKEVASTQDPALIRLTSGYAQYHEMLYTNYAGDGYGVGASLIDMSNTRSLLNFDENPDLKAAKLIVHPFGESFLLGSKDQIIHLSSIGTIIKRYALPKAWVDQSYQILYYVR